MLALLFSTSCIHKELARNLRNSYSEGEAIGIPNINFQTLQGMKVGEACSYELFYIFPVIGDNSIISAAKKGEIDRVLFIGESGFWTFPFAKNCITVYGN